MNRQRLIKITYATLAALMLAACASDELTDGTVQDLPEGKYPLQISSVTISAESTAEPWGASSPQTRVSESPTDGKSSLWDGGEKITVQLSGTLADGTTSYKAEEKYKLNDDKTSLTSVSGEELYWHSTSAGTVTAWYSNYTSGNIVNFSDQSIGLAYVLATTVQDASYNTPLSLSFTHKLAKIRVTLAGTADMEEGTVKVKGYTQGTITNGNVAGSDEGWITMQRISYSDGTKGYEANVIPGLALYKSAFQVTPKNGAPVPVDLDASVSVASGQLHKITLTVNKTGTKAITLAKQGAEYTVPQNASVLIRNTTSGNAK